MNITEIREAYPNAVSCKGADSSQYCVAGAFFQHLGRMVRWPLDLDLAKTLYNMNSHLTKEKAYRYACRMIKRNDKGDIDGAWVWLQTALSYRPAAPPHPNYSQLARRQ